MSSAVSFISLLTRNIREQAHSVHSAQSSDPLMISGSPHARLKRLSLHILFALLVMGGVNGCVVKEELNDTYNQAHLGMNQWSLLSDSTGSYRLEFDAGYLVGLVDEEGVDAIFWRYELMTTNEELIALNQEEMRPASPERTQVFVEGRRQRELELNTLLREGDTYILWFTLYYNEEILHEQLFPITAGEEGSDPYWLEELIGERLGDDVTPSDLNAGESSEATEDTLEDMLEEVEETSSDAPEGAGGGMAPSADGQDD